MRVGYCAGVKYAVLIPLGAGDEPQASLGDRTPLEAASTPNLDAIATAGRVALVQTVAEDSAASDVAGLVGMLDASASENTLGLESRVTDGSLAALGGADSAWVYSLGWMVTQDRSGAPSAADDAVIMEWDESTLTAEETALLWSDIAAAWRRTEPGVAEHMRLEPAEDRWVLIDETPGHDHAAIATHAPWRLIEESWRAVEPGGGQVEATWALRRLMHVGATVLSTHDVNVSRFERGLPLITMPWPWGGGRRPRWPQFQGRFSLRGAMITDDTMAAAVARAIGWPVTRVDAGMEEKIGELAIDALGSHDLVCVCCAGARRAAIANDPAAKLRAIEAFDRGVVGPVATRLKDFGDPEADADARGWRLMVIPDAVWACGDYEPTPDPVPALLAGAWFRSIVHRPFDEPSAHDSDLRIAKPRDLMEFFLLGGLAKAKAVGRRKEETGTLWELDP